MTWTRTLADADIGSFVLDAEHVLLTTPAGRLTMHLRSHSRALSPSQLPVPPSRHGLLHLPRISVRAMSAAEASGWSVVTDDGHLSLLLDDGTRLRSAPVLDQGREATRPPGPPQYGRFAIARALLGHRPSDQARLAALVGMTQPRVSRILAQLDSEGLLTRTAAGRTRADWDLLCDWFLDRYPGPGGLSTHWYSLEPTVGAATEVMRAAAATGVRAALSGDPAADLVLPWRRPQHAVVYAERGVDLAARGFTPADSPADANVTLIVPKDRGVWSPGRWRPDPGRPGLEVADPVQVLYDLRAAPGSDAHEAANRWRDALRDRTFAEPGAADR